LEMQSRTMDLNGSAVPDHPRRPRGQHRGGPTV
jgi:hypothetical protein